MSICIYKHMYERVYTSIPQFTDIHSSLNKSCSHSSLALNDRCIYIQCDIAICICMYVCMYECIGMYGYMSTNV